MVQSWQTAWLSTIYDKRTLGFPSGKCCTYFSFLFCHICACTFVTGVCKLKRFIDFANISIRTSRFFFFICYEKNDQYNAASKKTPKQSISYDFVAVTLARITFQSDTFIFSVLNFFFVKPNLNRRFCLNNLETNRRVPVLIENPALIKLITITI